MSIWLRCSLDGWSIANSSLLPLRQPAIIMPQGEWWNGRHRGLKGCLSHGMGNRPWDAVKFGETPAVERRGNTELSLFFWSESTRASRINRCHQLIISQVSRRFQMRLASELILFRLIRGVRNGQNDGRNDGDRCDRWTSPIVGSRASGRLARID